MNDQPVSLTKEFPQETTPVFTSSPQCAGGKLFALEEDCSRCVNSRKQLFRVKKIKAPRYLRDNAGLLTKQSLPYLGKDRMSDTRILAQDTVNAQLFWRFTEMRNPFTSYSASRPTQLPKGSTDLSLSCNSDTQLS